MTKDEYQEYLRGDWWRSRRDRVYEFADKRCQICNEPATNIHHNTYDNIGAELDRDLIAVCDKCHKLFHGKVVKPYDDKNFWPRIFYNGGWRRGPI
jgi:5-methylcytosine-specific restriction endonuclease McrA